MLIGLLFLKVPNVDAVITTHCGPISISLTNFRFLAVGNFCRIIKNLNINEANYLIPFKTTNY